MPDIEKMDDTELSGIVAGEVRSALGFIGGELTDQRREALELYHGEKTGELAVDDPNRSSVVMRDVADTVEWILPSLLKIFTSGDDVVRFEPQGPEDEAAAKQATEYCNWVFNRDNEGFKILYTMFKDGLLQKNGIVKTWWEEIEKDEERTLYGIDDDTYQHLLADPDVEITEHTEIAPEIGAGSLQPGAVGGGVEPGSASPLASPPPTHDVTYKRSSVNGKCCSEPVPPEEFLIARRAKDIQTSPYVGHRQRKLLSDLIAEGYPRDVVMNLSGDDADVLTDEEVTRWDNDDSDDSELNDRKGVMREVWVTESYIRVDADGDGIAERRKIVTAGTGYKILENEKWDGPVPFASVSPILQPHKFIGYSIPDMIKDLQVIKSTILRQTLDNLYLSNNPRNVISEDVVVDDYVNPRPGGAVRLQNGARPGDGHVVPLVVPFVGGQSFTMLEYLDTVKENRTGVTRYNQGLDANSLNKTATGINQITQAAQQRIELIARIYAETGVKDIFKQILFNVVKYQNKPRIIRLRNDWVPIDPNQWDHEFDMTINVGLGTGNRDQMAGHLMNLLGIQMQAVQFQQGIQGPFVTGENLYNTVAKLVENMGLKSPELYFTDPKNAEPQPEKPDPEMLKMQQEAQLKQQEMAMQGQFKEKELQLKTAEAQANFKLKEAELGANLQLKQQQQHGDMALKRETSMIKAQPAQNIVMGADGAMKALSGEMQSFTEPLGQLVQAFQQFAQQQSAASQEQSQKLDALLQLATAPRVLERDANGRAVSARVQIQ